MADRLDLNNNKNREPKTSNMPDTTISLPKYLFDLYQTSSVDIVLTYLNPYNQLGLTFSKNNGNPDIISDKPTKIKIVISSW